MRYTKLAGVAMASCISLLPVLAYAGPNDEISTPTVEPGEREIDFKWGAQKSPDGARGAAFSLGFAYGINAWWATEIYANYKQEPGATNSFDAWAWENRFQLTETGRYPVDVGFMFEIERPKDQTEGYELSYGPLFQAEWGRVQGNFNLLMQKHVRGSAAFDTELHYQGQLKYRQAEQFEWGVQAFGSLGPWDHWSPSAQQEHKFGPALFGKIRTGTASAIKWNAALLRGSNTATRTTLRFQAEYEF